METGNTFQFCLAWKFRKQTIKNLFGSNMHAFNNVLTEKQLTQAAWHFIIGQVDGVQWHFDLRSMHNFQMRCFFSAFIIEIFVHKNAVSTERNCLKTTSTPSFSVFQYFVSFCVRFEIHVPIFILYFYDFKHFSMDQLGYKSVQIIGAGSFG